MKWKTRQFRNYNDFKFGSFSIYVKEKEVVIRGILKKSNNPSLYMIVYRCDSYRL